MPTKIKKTQAVDLDKPHGRDLFQTPNYATDILARYIPAGITTIWECAQGQGKISNRLSQHGYKVYGTDIQTGFNFLYDYPKFLIDMDNTEWSKTMIVTNPPFSLKRQFFNRCLYWRIPFALLIPADYCLWTIDAVRIHGCQKIIPTRRIDYITPSGLSGKTGNTSNFHSLWLTRDLGIKATEIFVELTNEMKKNV